jgi:hypothetical protein
MDLPVQNGFEKPDKGRFGGPHSREQEASPMPKDLSVLWSDIAKPVFPVVGMDTTGRVLVRKQPFLRAMAAVSGENRVIQGKLLAPHASTGMRPSAMPSASLSRRLAKRYHPYRPVLTG